MENLIEYIKLAYQSEPINAEHLTIGVDSEGEFGAYYNNHSVNWIALGNLKRLYLQVKDKFIEKQ